MSLNTYLKYKLFQSTYKRILEATTFRNAHRKLPKFKNDFAFKNSFKKAFDSIKEEHSVSRIVSSDVVLGKKKNKCSTGDSQISPYRRKNKRGDLQNSLEYRGELLFGLHPVYLALLKNKRKFHKLFIASNNVEETNRKDVSQRTEIMNMAKSLKIAMSNISSKELRYLIPGAVHQLLVVYATIFYDTIVCYFILGVCLDAAHIPLLEWKETESEVVPNEFPIWLVFDEILDPMNVGAIIRSAYYFGVKKIFTVRGNNCKMSPTVSKASSGAMEIMDIYQIENLEYFIKIMISQNWNIVSTKAYNNDETGCGKLVNVLDFKLREPTILVLGNEGRGVSSVIRSLCNNFISIYPPHTLHKGIDSLNVSVATGMSQFST